MHFDVLMFLSACFAGFLGSLTGLGGGVVITPVLALLFHVHLRQAMGASLVSVIATSSGAASAYVREGLSNVRIGLFLEIATSSGAIVGAMLTSHTSTRALSIVFGIVLLGSAATSMQQHAARYHNSGSDSLAQRLHLSGFFSSNEGVRNYTVERIKTGFGLMFSAGIISGLLGIGSGALKVIAMDRVMRIPFKVSTATSNFMIGVTAAASAGVYMSCGYIRPEITFPVVLGVLGGSILGARILPGTKTKSLRLLFALVVGALAVEMIYGGATGRL